MAYRHFALFFRVLGLLSPVLASATEMECEAGNFSELMDICINQQAKAKDPATRMKILLTGPITLGKGQVIRLSAISNIIIQGQGLASVISETKDRMMDAASNANSRHLVEVVGPSKQITLANLTFRDAVGSAAFLLQHCRVGANEADPPNPNFWDTRYCRAPILIGSTSDKDDYARELTLDRLDIITHKATLMEIRKTANLIVSNSSFDGGTVFGVLMQPFFRHVNSTFINNQFQHAGTAALNIFNSFNALVFRNKFVDNHIDPQFPYCAGGTGAPPDCIGGELRFYPGGQVYVAETAADINGAHHEYENLFVRVLNNEISMTAPYLGHRSTTGVEIMNGVGGKISDVLVQGNFIHDISRNAIAVHNASPDQLRQERITIKNNRLYNNYRDYQGVSLAEYVQLEIDPLYFPNPLHPNVDIEGNRLQEGGGAEIIGSFAGTPKACTLDSATHLCAIELKWSVQGLPAGMRPFIKVNGKGMKAYPVGTGNGTVSIPWISPKNANFTLHLSATDPNPVASINVVGVDP